VLQAVGNRREDARDGFQELVNLVQVDKEKEDIIWAGG
jgi:hypothetical protein